MKLHELHKLMAAITDPAILSGRRNTDAFLRSQGLEPGNFYQELEMSSAYVDTHRDITYQTAPLALHSHTFFEILYCRSSCGAEYLLGTSRYRLRHGDVVIIPPGVSHRPLLPEKLEVPYERDVLWVSAEFMSYTKALLGGADTWPESIAPIRTVSVRRDSLEKLFRSGVLEAEEKKPGWEAWVMGNTLQIFAQLKRAVADRNARPMRAEQPQLLDRLTAYIEAEYSSHITLTDLSGRFFVSESTISHLFREKLGISVYRYITQRRLIAAKTLITEGHLLEDIATRVGFSDYSSFYRAFRQEFGISPRQFRKL